MVLDPSSMVVVGRRSRQSALIPSWVSGTVYLSWWSIIGTVLETFNNVYVLIDTTKQSSCARRRQMNVVPGFVKMWFQLVVFIIESFVYIDEGSSMDITLSFNYLINIINTSVPTWTDTAQVNIYGWVFIFNKTHKLFIFYSHCFLEWSSQIYIQEQYC